MAGHPAAPALAIVTNGDSAAAGLAAVAPGAVILPWRDMLHDGPVPAGLGLTALSELRAGWLAAELGLDPAETLAAFRDRDRRLASLPSGAEVVVCLEHDLYDQLQLLQILTELAPRATPAGDLLVTLAQADDHLGPQAPESLAALLARRRPVAAGAFAAAARLWSAFRAPTPEPLAAGARAAVPELPWLAPALARLLEELPDAAGLSRTERTALSLLAEAGEATAADLFAGFGEREEARFLGDWPFLRRVEGLAVPPSPLLAGVPGPFRPGADGPAGVAGWARARLRLTDAGREALAGERDRVADRPPDRWLGGTHLRPGRIWRWDAATHRLRRDPS